MRASGACLLLLALSLFALAPAAAEEVLSYDSASPQVNMSYDSLGRVLTKTAGNDTTAYTYDADFYGTLTNVTYGNTSYSYEYDDRLRVTVETHKIDGISFVKKYYYDSAGRLVKQTLSPGGLISYYYSEQGGVDIIPGYINDTMYNAFGKPETREYYPLTTGMSYDNETGRLTRIETGTLQNISYAFDNAGNIVSINDTANNRYHNMSYDYLDRLTGTIIAGTTYSYVYSPIGNIEKIIINDTTTKFHYGSTPVHAPSRIETLVRGVDVHDEKELHFANKTRVIEFWLGNENSRQTKANWSIDFADGTTVDSTTPFNLTSEETVMVIAAHNYSSGGTYGINITGRGDTGVSDEETLTATFGIFAKSLNAFYQNITQTFFELWIGSDITENTSNIAWNCSDSLSSTLGFNLSDQEDIMVLIEHNYTSAGAKSFACSANSSDGSGSATAGFTIEGITLTSYNRTALNESTHLIQFTILNSYYLSEINWTLESAGQRFSNLMNLSYGASESVSQGITYSTDGEKNLSITLTATGMSDSQNFTFVLKAVEVEDHFRYNLTPTAQLLEYKVWNYWPSNQTVSWNLTEPAITSTQSATLAEDKFLFVFVEENYTTRGKKNPTLTAWSTISVDSYADRFSIKPLHIMTLLVLAEKQLSSVFETFARSNMGKQTISWLLDTGQENISSTQTADINYTDSVFIFIETNYSTRDVFSLNMTLNSSSQDDSATGVVTAKY